MSLSVPRLNELPLSGDPVNLLTHLLLDKLELPGYQLLFRLLTTSVILSHQEAVLTQNLVNLSLDYIRIVFYSAAYLENYKPIV